MSHPFPFRRRKTKPVNRKETPWEKAWRISPERMREHLTRMNDARTKKAEQNAELIQAILNALSEVVTEPIPPYKLRDLFQETWNESYGEEKTKREAWNLLRIAMRNGMIGRTENGLIYPRKS